MRKLSAAGVWTMIEVNISCPNVKAGGLAYGTSLSWRQGSPRWPRPTPESAGDGEALPNVTDITEIARAVEARTPRVSSSTPCGGCASTYVPAGPF